MIALFLCTGINRRKFSVQHTANIMAYPSSLGYVMEQDATYKIVEIAWSLDASYGRLTQQTGLTNGSLRNCVNRAEHRPHPVHRELNTCAVPGTAQRTLKQKSGNGFLLQTKALIPVTGHSSLIECLIKAAEVTFHHWMETCSGWLWAVLQIRKFFSESKFLAELWP